MSRGGVSDKNLIDDKRLIAKPEDSSFLEHFIANFLIFAINRLDGGRRGGGAGGGEEAFAVANFYSVDGSAYGEVNGGGCLKCTLLGRTEIPKRAPVRKHPFANTQTFGDLSRR